MKQMQLTLHPHLWRLLGVLSKTLPLDEGNSPPWWKEGIPRAGFVRNAVLRLLWRDYWGRGALWRNHVPGMREKPHSCPAVPILDEEARSRLLEMTSWSGHKRRKGSVQWVRTNVLIPDGVHAYVSKLVSRKHFGSVVEFVRVALRYYISEVAPGLVLGFGKEESSWEVPESTVEVVPGERDVEA